MDKFTSHLNLPSTYDALYHSAYLKSQITDIGMWAMIPGIDPVIDSPKGARRMKENEPLFKFIDKYFPDGPFAFEPNMQDGRFVFLPAEVDHQGIGICASQDVPGMLDVGHFWYPEEFTANNAARHVDQVWVCMFKTNLYEDLMAMVKSIYFNTTEDKYCIFPFGPQHVVMLKGNFLDKLDASIKRIENGLKDADERVKRNGEGLTHYMKWFMGS